MSGDYATELSELKAKVMDLEKRSLSEGGPSPQTEALRASILSRVRVLVAKLKENVPKSEILEAQPSLVKQKSSVIKEKTVRRAFELYDEDKSGFLDHNEIVNLTKKLGLEEGENQADLVKAIEELDTDKDGKVSFEEFSTFMNANEVSGNLSTGLRAKLLRGKLNRQMSKMKSRVDQLSASDAVGPDGAERKLDFKVVVGGEPPEDAPTRAFLSVVAKPHEELAPEDWLSCAKYTLAIKDGASDEAITNCTEFMQNMYQNALGDNDMFRSFEVQREGRSLIITVKLDPEEPVQMIDKMLFAGGRTGAADFDVNFKIRSNLNFSKIANSKEPYDLTKDAKAMMQVIGHVKNDQWFEHACNMIAPPDSDDEDDELPENERFKKEQNMAPEQKFMKYVAPKICKLAAGSRGSMEFASLEDLLKVISTNTRPEMELLTAFTRERFHKEIIFDFVPNVIGIPGEIMCPPGEMYNPVANAIGGLTKIEGELQAPHGSIKATVEVTGFHDVFNILPEHEQLTKAFTDPEEGNVDLCA